MSEVKTKPVFPPCGRFTPILNSFCLALVIAVWSRPLVTSADAALVLSIYPTEAITASTVTFDCNTEDTPIRWHFNGKLMSNGSGKGATSTQRVLTASVADTGIYQCKAWNGSVWLSSNNETLIVYTIPVISRRPVDDMVRVGQDVTFSAEISNFYGSAVTMNVIWGWEHFGTFNLAEKVINGTENGMVNVSHVLRNVSDSANYSLHLSSHLWNSDDVPIVHFLLTVKPLVPPENLAIRGVTNSSFVLSWNYPPSSGSSTKSVFFYGLSSGDQIDQRVDARPGVSSLIVKQLTECESYQVYGKAEGMNRHRSGNSPISNVTTLMTPLDSSKIFVNTSGQVMVTFKGLTRPLCIEKITEDQREKLCQIVPFKSRHILKFSDGHVFKASLNETASSLATLFTSCLTEGVCTDEQLLTLPCRDTTNTPPPLSGTPTNTGTPSLSGTPSNPETVPPTPAEVTNSANQTSPTPTSKGSGGIIAGAVCAGVIIGAFLIAAIWKRRQLRRLICERRKEAVVLRRVEHIPLNLTGGDSTQASPIRSNLLRQSQTVKTPSTEHLIAPDDYHHDRDGEVCPLGQPPSGQQFTNELYGETRPFEEDGPEPTRRRTPSPFPSSRRSLLAVEDSESMDGRRRIHASPKLPLQTNLTLDKIFDAFIYVQRQMTEFGDQQEEIRQEVESLRESYNDAKADSTQAATAMRQPVTVLLDGPRRKSEDNVSTIESSVTLPREQLASLNWQIESLQRQLMEKESGEMRNKQQMQMQAERKDIMRTLRALVDMFKASTGKADTASVKPQLSSLV
eukprot:m.85721 g.85721  ORF g.85721 m.85721 type:complete len:794 (+) comp36462_c0_seq3:27-2408(+)